jgi:trehalose synthase
MIDTVRVERSWNLSDYASVSHLAEAVRELRVEASMLVPPLRGRKIWMLNSTARGGGVAEMLPRMVALLEELDLAVEWVVMDADRREFFQLTKRLHNLIHGEGDPRLTDADRELYEDVCRRNAAELEPRLGPDDVLVVHDPQPLAIGSILKGKSGIRSFWRCHIGFETRSEATRAAWMFLKPYAEVYDRAVFSSPEYIPDYFAGKATVIHPAIDPFSHKNRDLSPHKLVGVLCNAGLVPERHPVLTPAFSNPALRLDAKGSFVPAGEHEEIGLLFRPIVSQISRWDRLKGFGPLLDGFVKLKERARDSQGLDPRHQHRLELVRLVLAGPDPTSIQDDPEATEVLDELIRSYRELPEPLRKDVAILSLPMRSLKENALMVNALQRCSTVVVQNSLREAFGLTATEAMWKGVPIVASWAHGLREQVRNGIDGVLIQNPEDPDEIARRLNDALEDPARSERLALNAQQRVRDDFLVFTQLCRWLRVLSSTVNSRQEDGRPERAGPTH